MLAERDGQHVNTLTRDWLPPGFRGYRIGGLGGWMEPGETPWETVAREVREEASVDVVLRDAPTTWLLEPSRQPIEVECIDRPAPVLVTRYANALGPGDVFIVEFVGELVGYLVPGDDVEALLMLPPTAWPASETTLGTLLAAGGRLIGAVDPETPVWVHPDDTRPVLLRLLGFV